MCYVAAPDKCDYVRMLDEDYMREALRLAEQAAADGEVPVGAVW